MNRRFDPSYLTALRELLGHRLGRVGPVQDRARRERVQHRGLHRRRLGADRETAEEGAEETQATHRGVQTEAEAEEEGGVGGR